eukprot:TRINITY_DN24590_c0_g1_i7.p1 TRINITY_DN24590_c0_g1~~TRINITY_DN24590_c0_g1_i7.p1  ORF type:complete len:100 (+),score=0.17 TRINITY_DN24590_c0_g1_i7:49-348(+)
MQCRQPQGCNATMCQTCDKHTSFVSFTRPTRSSRDAGSHGSNVNTVRAHCAFSNSVTMSMLFPLRAWLIGVLPCLSTAAGAARFASNMAAISAFPFFAA